ncbi:hypothetical protein GCM10010129_59540 [Streptomyces fumigatiscleroticus]|nr:hypothetical protein GCM10010129_59540 [Streptomyces fumigatiscleroticus]
MWLPNRVLPSRMATSQPPAVTPHGVGRARDRDVPATRDWGGYWVTSVGQAQVTPGAQKRFPLGAFTS